MPAETDSFIFEKFSAEELSRLTSKRDGEKKLGEEISIDPLSENIHYVILGIEESIGPLSNHGKRGAENGFQQFLKKFLNMQSNRFLDGKSIAIAGKIKQNCSFESIEKGRKLVSELDDLVSSIVQDYFKENKILIVIGGGHNNAFPLIRSLFLNTNAKVSVINLDPHADCRQLEGRHSGNPFSYAQENGYLESYSVLGLHKSYNSEMILNYLNKNNFSATFFEDYVIGSSDFKTDVTNYYNNQLTAENVGIELDMDSIEFNPSSAFTPSGISLQDARYYVASMATLPKVKYLHLPEGAPENEAENKISGKALAYLVWDFIHSHSKNT